uniref:Phosphatidylinositol transfer protein cytoplasmic 1b n=1 Tax=Eptatretus burgeri TaxID=7764 RepID=A0A8C4WTU3_EPTBU
MHWNFGSREDQFFFCCYLSFYLDFALFWLLLSSLFLCFIEINILRLDLSLFTPLPPCPQYQVGQLYMISKHSHEQSEKGEGVEVVSNEPYEDPIYGQGQYTEKRIHLSSKLPGWAQAVVPRIFYVTEKAWNYYPHTITGNLQCSFLPKFSIYIKTKYEDNNGQNDNVFEDDEVEKEVVPLDIAFDELPERYYKESEDPRKFQSWKTQRGPLCEGWRDTFTPIMCSYKLTTVKFEVWGLQTRVEQFVHKAIRDILLAGHRQAFAWIDEWHGGGTNNDTALAHSCHVVIKTTKFGEFMHNRLRDDSVTKTRLQYSPPRLFLGFFPKV